MKVVCVCGTSLFYEYLVSNNLIDVNNKAIQDFSQLTRKYDTWEWKTNILHMFSSKIMKNIV